MYYCGLPALPPRRDAGGALPWEGPGLVCLHTCRTGIHYIVEHILKPMAHPAVLLPAYHCGVEVAPFVENGIACSLYRIKPDFSLDLEDLLARITPAVRLIYVTHYLGFCQELDRLSQICRERNILLVEDCALSLLSHTAAGQPAGSRGDIALYNFPKFFSLPDGGAIRFNNPNFRPQHWSLTPPTAGQIARAFPPMLLRQALYRLSNAGCLGPLWRIKHRDRRTAEPPSASPLSGQRCFNPALSDVSMSHWTRRRLERVDVERVIQARRDNYQHYLNHLQGLSGASLPRPQLPPGACPLFFPMIVPNRPAVARALWRHAIAALEWWPTGHPDFDLTEFAGAVELKTRLLALPLHERLGEKQIGYCVKHLREALQSS